MEAIVLALFPSLSDYPFLLTYVSCILCLFFGSFVFSGIWKLLTGWFEQ